MLSRKFEHDSRSVPGLTLPLLMPGIFTDDPNHAVSPNDSAIAAHRLHGCPNLHFTPAPLGGFVYVSASPISLEIGLLQQTFVLVRHEVGLDLRHEIHYDDDDDQQ